MDPIHFAYWLQGFCELTGDKVPTREQWDSIREHLGLVFNKVTKPVNAPSKKQADDTTKSLLEAMAKRSSTRDVRIC